MSLNNNNIEVPIVDTDIWVFLVMSGYYKRLIKYYGYLQFSDVVEKEIMRWKKSSDDSKEIAMNFQTLKYEGKLKVILFENFDILEQKSINHQLNEYGLKAVNIQEKTRVNSQVCYMHYTKALRNLRQMTANLYQKLVKIITNTSIS